MISNEELTDYYIEEDIVLPKIVPEDTETENMMTE